MLQYALMMTNDANIRNTPEAVLTKAHRAVGSMMDKGSIVS